VLPWQSAGNEKLTVKLGGFPVHVKVVVTNKGKLVHISVLVFFVSTLHSDP
jgi:hypothetical protein